MPTEKYTIYIAGEPVPGYTDVDLEKVSSYVYLPEDVSKSTWIGVTVINGNMSASGFSKPATINGPPHISSLVLNHASVGNEIGGRLKLDVSITAGSVSACTLYMDGMPVDGYVGVSLDKIQTYEYTPLMVGRFVHVELIASNEYGNVTKTSNTVVVTDTSSFTILIDTTTVSPDDSTFSFGGEDFAGRCDVYWGDGSSDYDYEGGELIHVYDTPGQYEVRVSKWINIGVGIRPSFGDVQKITEIRQWGTAAWTSMENAFRGCSNISGIAIDAPNLGNCTSTSCMFARSSFNQDINDWDMSSVTDMSFMFANDDIDGAKNPFNQPLNNWNVSSATNMVGMFMNSEFNHPIGDWDVSSVSNVGDGLVGMYSMFAYSSFNQSIGSWDVSNVTNMFGMFAYSSFNQDIGPWSLNASVNMEGMFSSSQMSSENYSRTLIGWANEASLDGTPVGVSLGASGVQASSENYGGAPFTSGMAARGFLVDSLGWIVDDG